MQIIENKNFDEERALYGLKGAQVTGCRFEGKADGESALKECRGVDVKNCFFALRYPLWHAEDFNLISSEMTDTARAAIWYAKRGVIANTTLGGIKALRECEDMVLKHVKAVSPEFGWRSRSLSFTDCDITGEYPFFECRDAVFDSLTLHGKYSFQYVENVTVRNSVLDTKDAFWHCKNVRVENSVIKGEYLSWYSDGLTLVNCKIIGTQPLCYCKNLTLIDCETEGCDLAFENSFVNAAIKGNIVSVKNPVIGHITADSIGEIILDEHRWENSDCIISERGK